MQNASVSLNLCRWEESVTFTSHSQSKLPKYYEHTNNPLITDFFPEDGEDQEDNDPMCEHLDPKLLDFAPDISGVSALLSPTVGPWLVRGDIYTALTL